MDPYSRRFTWEVVRRRAAAAAVVLTTHSMEEADTLADDIVIMAQVRRAGAGLLGRGHGAGEAVRLSGGRLGRAGHAEGGQGLPGCWQGLLELERWRRR
jgi:hypothetical protein